MVSPLQRRRNSTASKPEISRQDAKAANKTTMTTRKQEKMLRLKGIFCL